MSAVSVAAAGHAGDAAKLLKISHRRQDKLRVTPVVAIRHGGTPRRHDGASDGRHRAHIARRCARADFLRLQICISNLKTYIFRLQIHIFSLSFGDGLLARPPDIRRQADKMEHDVARMWIIYITLRCVSPTCAAYARICRAGP